MQNENIKRNNCYKDFIIARRCNGSNAKNVGGKKKNYEHTSFVLLYQGLTLRMKLQLMCTTCVRT